MSCQLANSPFARVLYTNHTPSEIEARQIRAHLLEQPANDLARLDAEMLRLQAKIDELFRERKEVERYIDDHRALLSPLRRLPPEVMGEIFVHCLSTKRNRIRRGSEAPLLLGRICSAWRDISISTHRLWSSFRIHIPIAHRHQSERDLRKISKKRIEMVKTWFSRSGALPMSISLESRWSRMDDNSYFDSSTSSVLEFIFLFSHRWKRLELRASYPMLRLLGELTSNDIPLLEEIKIKGTSFRGGPLDFSILGKGPRLHALSCIHLGENFPFLAIPWGRLTHLSLNEYNTSSLDPNQILAALQQCPNLQKGTFGVRKLPPTGFVLPPIPITLPSLHTLHLNAHTIESQVDLKHVFEHILLPGLREISLKGFINRRLTRKREKHVPFISLLSHGPSPITKVTISYPVLSRDALIECLEKMPSLTTLVVVDYIARASEISKPILDDVLLHLLTPTWGSDTSSGLSPCLETVNFQYSGFSDEALLRFVRSRRPPLDPHVSTLKSIHVSFDRITNVASQMQSLSVEGLQYSITYTDEVFASPTPSHTKPEKRRSSESGSEDDLL